MNTERITIKKMLSVIFKREFYIDMVVFIFVCIPLVLFILFFTLKIDSYFGIRPFIKIPYNIIAFFILSILGGLIVWRSYAYLVLIGEGSPCPQLGGTNKLVTCGPYALVRHPSVIGKLFGVIGLGCLFQATFFTFVVIPVLFAWSAFYNRFMQEKGCQKKFGQDYSNYRKNVPMFIPRPKKIKS
ncbi:MAG: methyltransferase [Candidatus Omnitrophica bacterium]|nr:methyltransferase [Candidatus Omnitrophota bacterium]